MKHVETNSSDVQRLLHVKGKRNVLAGEVSRPSWDTGGDRRKGGWLEARLTGRLLVGSEFPCAL